MAETETESTEHRHKPKKEKTATPQPAHPLEPTPEELKGINAKGLETLKATAQPLREDPMIRVLKMVETIRRVAFAGVIAGICIAAAGVYVKILTTPGYDILFLSLAFIIIAYMADYAIRQIIEPVPAPVAQTPPTQQSTPPPKDQSSIR